ncbi:MAG: hypothetical protein FWG12_03675 [Holophagaceae bacterium]|nr:hypothetical protein [Holophagaceae bacterium]
MKAHKLLCAGAAFAMLGAHAQAQEEGFFGGVKMRGAVQMYPREDKLMQYYGGAGYEVGYNFSFGRMSAELGILYKPGRNYMLDLSQMENLHESPINETHSVDNRRNQLNGMTFRIAYEKPMDGFSFRGGLQLGALKFRQELVADIRSSAGTLPNNPLWWDTYNIVHDEGGLSISPFFGVSVPVLTNHFVEANLVMLNYTSGHYVHVAGTVEAQSPAQNAHTTKDYIKTNGRLIPHIELAFGFRF